MADYCYRPSMHDELDDIHRLLPREILSDIGIVDPAEQHVDDLAAHLASVLGGAPKKTPCHHTPAQANAAARESLTGGPNLRRVAAPPPFLPPPATVPWHVMEGLSRRRSNMVLHPAATTPGFTFTPARPIASGAQPTETAARHRGAGTGVFLPRNDQVVIRRTAKAARSPQQSNGNHARVIHQRGQQAAMMAVLKKQQEMRAVVAANVERMYYLGVHPHTELALPLEWTY